MGYDDDHHDDDSEDDDDDASNHVFIIFNVEQVWWNQQFARGLR